VEQEIQGLLLQIDLQQAQVAFKPCRKFSEEFGGYASKDNESGDN
jgi:hypothetical protein